MEYLEVIITTCDYWHPPPAISAGVFLAMGTGGGVLA